MCSNADRIAWERTSSRNRITVAASVRLCAGGKFCRSKSCATLMASTIVRSELMRGTQDSGVPVTCGEGESSARSTAIIYARRSRTPDGPASTLRMAKLAACQTILNAIGNLLAGGCQVEEFLFAEDIFGFFGKLPIHRCLGPRRLN